MNIVFYIASIAAIASTVMVITRLNAIHALLYLIVSLLSAAVVFFMLGAPFVAALEVIVYAGAIMVLFVFVVMMLNLGPQATEQENTWFNPKIWIGPAILSAVLLAEFVYVLISSPGAGVNTNIIQPRQVGISLFTSYMLVVELAAMLLLAGIIGAYHLGRRKDVVIHRYFRGEVEGFKPTGENKVIETGLNESDTSMPERNMSGANLPGADLSQRGSI